MKEAKTIIDVRTKVEFRLGHIKGSISIPLKEIPNRVEEIKKMEPPIILCCASGGRSENAANYLQEKGLTCSNGGGWKELKEQLAL